jgi:hypothetical protein
MFLREGRAAVCYLKPPDHTIGGLGAERRYREHRGENRSSAAHIVHPPIPRRQYLLAFGAWQRSCQPDLGHAMVCPSRASAWVGVIPLI